MVQIRPTGPGSIWDTLQKTGRGWRKSALSDIMAGSTNERRKQWQDEELK